MRWGRRAPGWDWGAPEILPESLLGQGVRGAGTHGGRWNHKRYSGAHDHTGFELGGVASSQLHGKERGRDRTSEGSYRVPSLPNPAKALSCAPDHPGLLHTPAAQALREPPLPSFPSLQFLRAEILPLGPGHYRAPAPTFPSLILRVNFFIFEVKFTYHKISHLFIYF